MAVIETERLRLRELTLEDLPSLHRVLSDPVAMRHYPKPFSEEDSRGWIRWNLDNYREHGFGLWAVIRKAEGDLIGDCGLTYQRIDGVQELEVGYHILREAWCRGYATEGATACRDFAFEVLRATRLVSWMKPANTASWRVAEKIGMRFEKSTTDRLGKDHVVYSLAAEDWHQFVSHGGGGSGVPGR
ncbi:MAG: GNAT family N-acetyltransferase [Planctomycetota bacterium]|jgi:RimJ/RimL family protein N-acetyltransferase